jgi:hypothetical protein
MNAVKQVCVNCKTICDTSDLYCNVCGRILPHVAGVNLREITSLVRGDAGSAEDLQWGTGYFHPLARLFMRLENDILIPVSLGVKPVILGRRTPDCAVDVDLMPYNGKPLGVSRQHARIERGRDMLHIVDLDSSNGTFLNRQRLEPGVPHILRNRAIVQLGKMIMRVQFS